MKFDLLMSGKCEKKIKQKDGGKNPVFEWAALLFWESFM